MSKVMLGALCGLVWGALSAASMIPLEFTDKKAALLAAFLNRFAIGFVLGVARLPVPAWLNGLIFGVLLSLADAIITKAYAPILILGAIGGVVISLIVSKWASAPLSVLIYGFAKSGRSALLWFRRNCE